MPKLKRTGRAPYKARYTAYESENRANKNREKDLERHLKLHPNDEQAKKALKAGPKAHKGKPSSKMYPKVIVDTVKIKQKNKLVDHTVVTRLSKEQVKLRAKLLRMAKHNSKYGQGKKSKSNFGVVKLKDVQDTSKSLSKIKSTLK